MSIEDVRWLVSVINRRGILDVFAVRWYVVTRSLGSIDTNDITLEISWSELPTPPPRPRPFYFLPFSERTPFRLFSELSRLENHNLRGNVSRFNKLPILDLIEM